MKKSTAKVPQFDEIIFENRNKSYGAYDLRKRYKSTASFSVLCGVSLAALLVIALGIRPDPGIASARDPDEIVIIYVDPVKPDVVRAEEPKLPDEISRNIIKNLKPVVTDDTAGLTDFIPINEDIIRNVPDCDIADTLLKEPEVPVIPVETEPRIVVEEMPEFPGGITELLNYIATNLEYPEDALINNIQGRVVIKFVVNDDGSVDRSEVIRGIDPLLDNEALRVIGTLPKFRPGKQNGVAVPVWYIIPVVFKINN